MLGDDCNRIPAIFDVFIGVRTEALLRQVHCAVYARSLPVTALSTTAGQHMAYTWQARADLVPFAIIALQAARDGVCPAAQPRLGAPPAGWLQRARCALMCAVQHYDSSCILAKAVPSPVTGTILHPSAQPLTHATVVHLCCALSGRALLQHTTPAAVSDTCRAACHPFHPRAALANLVYAFEKANLLDCDMLSLVYCVAAYRLDRRCNSGQLAFKPQELCTLLRATHSNIAAPWRFLAKVHAMVTAFPHLVQPWSAAERVELERALALLDAYRTTRLLQQLQVDQQRVLQDQLAALVISSQIATPSGAMPVRHALPPMPSLGINQSKAASGLLPPVLSSQLFVSALDVHMTQVAWL